MEIEDWMDEEDMDLSLDSSVDQRDKKDRSNGNG